MPAYQGRCSTWTRRCTCETAIDACHTEYALIDATSTPPGASGISSVDGLALQRCPTTSTRAASPTCTPPAALALGELGRRRYRRRLDDPRPTGTLLTPSPLTLVGCCPPTSPPLSRPRSGRSRATTGRPHSRRSGPPRRPTCPPISG